MTTPKAEKRRARRQQNARDKTTTAPDPPTPNKGPQTMTTAPGPHNPNKGPQTMTTPPAPATPENSPFALVVEVSTKSANPATGRPGATIFSIQNPDGTYWANRRGRRRAWTSKESAEASRHTETNADRESRGLDPFPTGPSAFEPVAPPGPPGRPFPTGPSAFGPIPPPAPPAPPAIPPTVAPSRYSDATVASAHQPVIPPEVPYGLDNPDGERVGKLVAAAIAIDPRIARQVMDVVSSMIRTA